MPIIRERDHGNRSFGLTTSNMFWERSGAIKDPSTASSRWAVRSCPQRPSRQEYGLVVASLMPREVNVPVLDLARLRPVIGEQRHGDLLAEAARTRVALQGRTVWNVNSTATGGGVA